MADEDIQVIVLEDKVEAPAAPAAPAAAAPPPAAAPSTDPKDGIDDLKRQLAAKSAETDHERAARADAERRATEEAKLRAEAERAAAAEAAKTTTATDHARDAEYDAITTSLAAAAQEVEAIAGQIATLSTEGKFGEVAKLQARLGGLGARIERLEDGKAAIEAAKKAPKPAAEPAKPATRELSQQEKNDNFLRSIPAPSAAWIRAHPQFFTDPAFQDRVMKAAANTEANLGYNHNNPKYFEAIEEAVGLRRTEQRSDAVTEADKAAAPTAPAAAPAATRAAPIPAAPPTRTIPAPDAPRGRREVTLSKAEIEHARITLTKETSPQVAAGMDPVEVFARNKEALIAEGKWHGAQ
jgi:hypothetical protein